MAFLNKGLKMTRMRKSLKIFAVVFVLAAVAAGGFYAVSKKPSVDEMTRGLTAYKQGDYKTALRMFRNQDLLANPEASFILGAMHYAGKGVPADENRAFLYYEKAAVLGYSPAQTTLAILYADKGEWDKAYAYAESAALRNDAEAQMLAAGWYEKGRGGRFDTHKAVRFYEMAAKNGDMNAKTALYLINKDGKIDYAPNAFAAGRWQKKIKRQKALEKKLHG